MGCHVPRLGVSPLQGESGGFDSHTVHQRSSKGPFRLERRLAGPGSSLKDMEKIKIALIAHDGMKADMVSFVTKRLEFFNRQDVDICATGTTGKFIKFAGVAKVQTLLSGPKGGDAQIAAMVASEEIDAVIFFRDPLDSHPHAPDVQMLMRVCDVHVVPLATNYMSAKLLIDWFRSPENIAYWKKRKTED